MSSQKSPPTPVSKPGDPLDLGASVAGEEDPGASFDAPRGTEGRSDQPAGTAGTKPRSTEPESAPGDKAPGGIAGTGDTPRLRK